MKWSDHIAWLGPPAAFAIGYLLAASAPTSAEPRLALGPTSSASMRQGASEQHAARSVEPGAPASRSPATVRAVRALPSEMHRLGALAQLLEGFQAGDFRAHCDEMLRGITDDDFALLKLYFGRWAKVAPEEAAQRALAERVGRGRIMQGGFYAAIMAMAERDLPAALAVMAEARFDGAGPMRFELQKTALAKLEHLPPEEALRELWQTPGNESNPHVRSTAWALVVKWGAHDPDAAWKAALAFPGDARLMALEALFPQRARRNPEDARALMESMPAGYERMRWRKMFAAALIDTSGFAAAREYATSLPPGLERGAVLGELAASRLTREGDPEGALAFLAGLTAADWSRAEGLSFVLQQMMNKWPEQTAELVRAHVQEGPKPGSTNAFLDSVFSAWIQSDPRAAVAYLSRQPRAFYGQALDQAIRRWAVDDAAAVAAWAREQPPGQVPGHVLAFAVSYWTQKSSSEVAAWLEGLPAGVFKSSATEGFASALISLSPNDALAWLRTVPEEKERIERLRRVWKSWVDRRSAERWRDSSKELTAAERAALR